ncbi:MAG: hypothetical protein K0U12_00095, partial [Gammaproteobacteria bacterium]|nr:hypothetical protein [Gammaproteobacteria bacterium]
MKAQWIAYLLAPIFILSTAYAAPKVHKTLPNKPKQSNKKLQHAKVKPDYNLAWFTGPLLAPPGRTLPAGHSNFEPYLFITDSYGIYGNTGRYLSTPYTMTVSPTMVFTQGLAKRLDLQAVVPYNFNFRNNASDSYFADVNLVLGLQVLNPRDDQAWPALRMTFQETFPAGRYENLSANKNGTDATGAGSYQSALGANFQKLWGFLNGQFLRARLSINYT